MTTKKVVIVGGGFAGVTLAQSLSKDKHFDVILLDKNNYNFFPPLIYQVSTGFLEPSNISFPFRKLFHHQSNLHFRMGTMQDINAEENILITDTGAITYDYLIIASGTVTNYFGMESIAQQALPMKTIDDALHIRNTILLKFEKAAATADLEERKKLLTIVIAGAGPTGVEVSGMLSEMKKKIFTNDYPEFDSSEINIHLIDAADAVLSSMSKVAQKNTLNALQKLGIHVHLNAQVKSYTDKSVEMQDGRTIAADTLIWAAGVTVPKISDIPDNSIGRGKRIRVDENNLVLNTKNIYAIGDVCLQTNDSNFPNGHPQVAQVAIQQAKLLAKNFKAIKLNRKQKPFQYNDKGSMAIIGSKKAVADLGKLHFKGFLAWFVWLFIHLMSLIGYRNRIKTAYNWFLAYVTKDQNLRLIIRPSSEGKLADSKNKNSNSPFDKSVLLVH